MALNAVWMLAGQALRFILQGGCFVLVARLLGASNYGAFISVAALVAIMSPFAGCGAGNLLIRAVSRDRTVFPVYWGNALAMVLASGVLLTGVVVVIARVVLPNAISPSMVLVLCASDLLIGRVVDIAGQAFQAVERMGTTASLGALLTGARLAAAVIFAARMRQHSPLHWSLLYLASAALVAIVAFILVSCKIGRPQLALPLVRRELRDGCYFAGGLSAQTIYNDIDKVMLSRLAGLDAAGVYAAAYRLVDAVFFPVRSLLFAAYPSFFREGSNGIERTLNYATRLMRAVMMYSIPACVALGVCAPAVRVVLGPEYGRTVEALRWLCILPLLKTVHYFLADSLTGAEYQGLRTATQAGIATLNILINLWIIPAYSWRGAAWSSIVCDALLAATIWFVIKAVRRKEAAPAERIEIVQHA